MKKMLNVGGLFSALLVGVLFAVPAHADLYKDVNLNYTGSQTLPFRALLGLTEQNGYSGSYVAKVTVCGSSASGTATVLVVENQNVSTTALTFTKTNTCYDFPMPQPGVLDQDINYIQLKTNGDLNITGLGAYQAQ